VFEPYAQVEIINELPEDKTITVYRCGPLVDLCRGPHIPNTSFVKAFACLKVFFLLLFIELQVLLMKFSTSDLILRVNIRLQHHGISFPDSKRLKVHHIISAFLPHKIMLPLSLKGCLNFV
jgi:threonyl-tRNA synthetase